MFVIFEVVNTRFLILLDCSLESHLYLEAHLVLSTCQPLWCPVSTLNATAVFFWTLENAALIKRLLRK